MAENPNSGSQNMNNSDKGKQPFKKRYNNKFKKKEDLNSDLSLEGQDKEKSLNRKSSNQYRRHSNIKISVVAPVFNEEDSLEELANQLTTTLKRLVGNDYEVIWIDDGSTDSSYKIIKKICQESHNFKALKFRRNYGKSAALDAGFKYSKGSLIFTIDTDLQDDPDEFEKMIAKIEEGYDLVSGWKKRRKDPISKTLPSKLFNYVTSKTSGIKLHDFNCGIKVYKKEVVKSLDVYGEMHRYLPALAHWNGFNVTEIAVNHRPRRYGKSKFGVSRFINGYLDLLTVLFTTRYFKRPLHFFGLIGTLFATVGLGIDLYLTILWFMNKTDLSNRPLALFGVAMIIVGVQLISMGLIGELIVKNNLEKVNYHISHRI